MVLEQAQDGAAGHAEFAVVARSVRAAVRHFRGRAIYVRR